MPSTATLGSTAPDFDLSSTEGVVLMLRDEVVRTALVLYFFAAAGEREGRDLDALNRALDSLKRQTVRVLAISPLPLETLKTLQRERRLGFPLLHDDRSFSAAYGLGAETEGAPALPVLAVVDRQQALRHLERLPGPIEAALPQAERALKSLATPTQGYPKSIINRWIDRWIN